ncbi:hypothetical protein CRM22_010565 [Opisthorchis felineus]|uniref:Netrin-1 n=1 Tax=Opisthorchis felineus TaxID=147828 RepID=A0A4S2KXA9_OPIFE|nr:hypothetical protein CRM22_010565 [Opisthorchis felineus]
MHSELQMTFASWLLPLLTGFYINAAYYFPQNAIYPQSTEFNNTRSRSTVPYHKASQLPQLFDTASSDCRVASEDVNCLPPFQNIAYGRPVQTTSTCGVSKVQRLCVADGTCHVCGGNSKKWRFSPDHLTDAHSTKNYTCWASSLVRAGGPQQAVNLTISLGKRFEVDYVSLQPCIEGAIPDSIAIYKSSDFGRSWRPWHYFSTDCFRAFGLPTTHEYKTHITTANLQEVICVGLPPREDYFTKTFRRRRSSINVHKHVRRNHSSIELGEFEATLNSVISFSTTLGRPATQPWSPALIDWMTMTDVRISMMRFPASLTADYRAKRTVEPIPTSILRHLAPNRPTYISKRKPRRPYNSRAFADASYFGPYGEGNRRSFGYRHLRSSQTEYGDLAVPPLDFASPLNGTNSTFEAVVPKVEQVPLSGPQLLSPTEPDVLSAAEFFALADLTIGGRCKCNGHAKECIVDASGHLRCACEHNTDGDDCERCKSGFMDRPWERATAQSAKSCTQCDCNLHSSECRFSNALYLMSNRVSGGVCENCQHNTAGRNCQHCAEGFYRDWTKPISHEHACLPCRCHPIGSIIRHDCDRRSGQCRCKQGVTGITCDRCLDGYHQTRSSTNPCTKDFAPQTMALAHTPAALHCTTCNTNKERIRLKKFCRKDAVLQATFKSRELHGSMARFEMHINQIWRLNLEKVKGPRGLFWPGKVIHEVSESTSLGSDFNILEERPRDLVPVWVHLNDLRCKCPEMELGISYLIVTDIEEYIHKGRREVRFTPKTALLPWRHSWTRRLTRFYRRQSRGACDRFKDPTKLNHDDVLRHPEANPPWYPAYSSSSHYSPNLSPDMQPSEDGVYQNSLYAHRRPRPYST